MGRNVRGHAYGDTGRSIDQQVGDLGWKYLGFSVFTVIVGPEVDGVLTQLGDHFRCGQ